MSYHREYKPVGARRFAPGTPTFLAGRVVRAYSYWLCQAHAKSVAKDGIMNMCDMKDVVFIIE